MSPEWWNHGNRCANGRQIPCMAISGKAYPHTNLLLPSMEARSPGAVSGTGIVPLALFLGSRVAPKLSAPSRLVGGLPC